MRKLFIPLRLQILDKVFLAPGKRRSGKDFIAVFIASLTGISCELYRTYQMTMEEIKLLSILELGASITV